MDYRDFLQAKQSMVLPYLGGLSVCATDRRLRVTERVAVGWWRFEVSGRRATPVEQAEAPDLSKLPVVRGHLVDGWLFVRGDAAERLFLLPEEDPPVFCPATARRWPSGDHLFEDVLFEDEPEDAARTALFEERSDLVGIKGVGPSLRAAFGFATLRRVARTRALNVSPREVVSRVHEIAGGTLTAEHLLDELEARRYQQTPQTTHRRDAARAHRAAVREATLENVEERVATVLDAAGAQALSTRFLGGQNLEVVFRYLGEQFIAVVDWQTLHVYDSGICLEGHDEQLGLDSLPSVIHEAIETDELHITRR